MDSSSVKSPWLTVEAVVLILLGIAALVAPLFAGVALTLALGLILTVAGAVGLVSALAGRHHVHLGWSLASAVLALLAGLFLIFMPLAGAVVLSLLVGVYLLLDGIALIGLALDHRKKGDRAWGWLMTAGVADLVLALFIMTLGAFGAAALIGIIVGIDLIFAGGALLLLHRATVVVVKAP